MSEFDRMGDAKLFGTIDGDPKLKDLKRTFKEFKFRNIFIIDAGNSM